MNIFQVANGGATFTVLGAIVFGTANAIKDSSEPISSIASDAPANILLLIFIVLFKIKTLFDDHKHFGEIYQLHSNLRYLGFILAVFSWFFMALSGFFISDSFRSAEFLGLAIIISSIWVIFHLIELWLADGRPATANVIALLREKWLVINMLYILLIVVFLGWVSPVVEKGTLWPLAVILLLLFFDMATSRPLKDLV